MTDIGAPCRPSPDPDAFHTVGLRSVAAQMAANGGITPGKTRGQIGG